MSARPAAALAALCACLGVALAAPPTPALAVFGPIRLVSKSPFEQASEAVSPALSADGRYLAFRGSIGGLGGVFREDLGSGAIEAVATNPVSEGAPPADAREPSISADGRYVAFTTTAPLDPVDDTEAGSNDVYVADMSTAPPTYALASALDAPGASCPAGVTAAAPGEPLGIQYDAAGSASRSFGSLASGRVALSASGRQVVFVTATASNLTSGAGGSTPGVPTPAGQVAVRNLNSGCTTLVSVEREPASGAMSDRPVPGGASLEAEALGRGASISADGSTVAWLSGHLPAQVPLLGDERQKIAELDDPAKSATPYVEPLWRRIAGGPEARTRRIVGGGDPLAPGCPPDGTLAEPACQGPFPGITDKNSELNPSSTGWLGPIRVSGVPQLSADGRAVALIGNPTEATNVFLVDMSPGLSRKQALRQLTRQVSVQPGDEGGQINKPQYVPLNGNVFDLAISPDGRRIAFTTGRQQFPLAPPNLITDPPSQLGLVELYEIDLDGETLRRVSHGAGSLDEASLATLGTARDGAGAASPSCGEGGQLLAFSSTAANLASGDGNDNSDAFVVEDPESPRHAAGATIDPEPPTSLPKPRWRLLLSARSLPSGKVRLIASVPGAGSLRARASAALAVGSKSRRLAKSRARAKAVGPVTMVLSLAPGLRRLARSQEGLYATARVAFAPRRGKRLSASLQVRFHAHPRRGGGEKR